MLRKILYIFFFALFFIIQVHAEIKEYFITCAPDDFEMIYSNYGDDIYIPINIMYNNQIWNDAEMRIRGETTRYAPKKSLKIKFSSAPFDNGRYKINLNADYGDKSYIHSFLTRTIFHAAGIPCFDAEHVRLYLNGNYLGLYLQVENMDEQFLEARGLDKNLNLIVDRKPRYNYVAKSTPELIVERLARQADGVKRDFYLHLLDKFQ